MFIQLFRGHVTDRAAVKTMLDKWYAEVAPGAQGWLGTTAGVTADDIVLGFVRYEDEASWQANVARPETTAWRDEMAQYVDGDVTIETSGDVMADQFGDPDAAGFVQVMTGTSKDLGRARELMSTHSGDLTGWRQDILGWFVCGFDDGRWTQVIYFTSEADAREGESKEPPAGMIEMMSELETLSLGEPQFHDLTEPWMLSPAG